jgi:hypothetical protein
MLTVYAAWIEGAVEADVIALRAAMGYPNSKGIRQSAVTQTVVLPAPAAIAPDDRPIYSSA